MPPFNAADRKSIRAAEKASILVATNDAEAITSIMASIPGRAWMWRQLSAAHIFDPNTIPDPRMSGIWDGERNFGLRLLADIMLHCPESYIQMTREANDRHHSNDRSPQSDALAERSGGSVADGGDSGSGEATGDYDPYSGSEIAH